MRALKSVMVTAAVLSFLLCAHAQGDESPTITFVNQSGENCLVKLIGLTAAYVQFSTRKLVMFVPSHSLMNRGANGCETGRR